jgi:hypothetical protein
MCVCFVFLTCFMFICVNGFWILWNGAGMLTVLSNVCMYVCVYVRTYIFQIMKNGFPSPLWAEHY